jgi:hypothetical protein
MIVGHHDVEVTVAIVVRVRRTTRHHGLVECGAQRCADVVVLPASEIAEHERWLAVLHLRLHAPDLLFDVTVARKDVQVAVQVVVEEEHAEREIQQAGAANGGSRRLVDEQPGAFVVIEGQHLIGEVPHEKVRPPGAVVIGRVHAHRSPGHAVFAVCDAGGYRLLREGALAGVSIQFVGLRIVGHEDVRPSVGVVVEYGDAERLAGGIGHTRLAAHVLETARSQIAV